MRYKPHLDLIAVSFANPNESVGSVVARITKKFQRLAQKWRDKLRLASCSEFDEYQTYVRQVPILYGFLIKSTVVAIMTYDASKPQSHARSLATLDHSRDGEDVWHALAIAIVCCRVRNLVLQLEKEGLIGEEVISEDDFGLDL